MFNMVHQPAHLQRFAALCRHWAGLADIRAISAPKTGILKELEGRRPKRLAAKKKKAAPGGPYPRTLTRLNSCGRALTNFAGLPCDRHDRVDGLSRTPGASPFQGSLVSPRVLPRSTG